AAPVVVGFGNARIDPDGLPVLTDRLVEPAGGKQRITPVVVRDTVRLEAKGLLILGDRLIPPALLGQRAAPAVLGFGVGWVYPRGLAVVGKRLLEPAGGKERVAPVIMGGCTPGREMESLPVAIDGCGEHSLLGQRVPPLDP